MNNPIISLIHVYYSTLNSSFEFIVVLSHKHKILATVFAQLIYVNNIKYIYENYINNFQCTKQTTNFQMYIF